MDDYIKRSEVLKTLKHLLYETAINNVECTPSFSEACKVIAANRIEGYLSAVPAADVRENVRGHWIKRKNWLNAVCSCCSFEEKYPRNFCPNCGADMRGEKDV